LSTQPAAVEQAQQLLAEFRLYDRNVDVVSAWETISTQSNTSLPECVRHFERFPSVVAPDGNIARPDFTVVFTDNRAIVAEIAQFALRDESVDDLCRQIGRYDTLIQLPVGGGALAAVESVDVMLLVPLSLGTDAVRRIIRERLENGAHPYSPSAPPIIVQFALDQDPERYVFQRRQDPGNGTFRDEGRDDGARLSQWFGRSDVKVRPEHFREIKASRAFVNDPVPSLYLATFLWAKTFADRAAAIGEGRPVPLAVIPGTLAAQVREEYGLVRTTDAEKALALLGRGRLAERSGDGWVVYWTELPRGPAERDLAETLARRSVRPPRRSTADLYREATGAEPPEAPQQGVLFEPGEIA
jgi:hypothetical protein